VIHVASVSPTAVAAPVQVDMRNSDVSGVTGPWRHRVGGEHGPAEVSGTIAVRSYGALADNVDRAVVTPISVESQRSRNREDACAGIRPRALPRIKGKVAVYENDPRIRRVSERERRVTCGREIGKNFYLSHQVLQVSNIGQVRIRSWERSGIIVESPVGIGAGDRIVDEVLDDVSSRKRSCSRGGVQLV
jgi:hypothetical protein